MLAAQPTAEAGGEVTHLVDPPQPHIFPIYKAALYEQVQIQLQNEAQWELTGRFPFQGYAGLKQG